MASRLPQPSLETPRKQMHNQTQTHRWDDESYSCKQESANVRAMQEQHETIEVDDNRNIGNRQNYHVLQRING